MTPRNDLFADPAAVVTSGNARFTVLTSRLLRIEYSPTRTFVDEPTQMVVSRRFPVPEFTVRREDETVVITTDAVKLTYVGGPFRPGSLSVTLRTLEQATHHDTWHYGDPDFVEGENFGNLGGTARTLDGVDGVIEVEPGILSRDGYAVIDDSQSCILTEDGWVEPRSGSEIDFYFFGYGSDAGGALRDYFCLTGPSPLLPRQALGNWWSRFYKYSQTEYQELISGLEETGVPLSVAVIDMDWHLVDIDPQYGSGWTGYTWNRDLFPSPEELLAWLHSQGLLVTLNDHPAGGIAAHEDPYVALAESLGIDPASRVAVDFDATSQKFIERFFQHVLGPLEDQGVDFWWIDWQSGPDSAVEGLDPLWILNHFYYLNSRRRGERPLILSRYAGPGSHRYPVGFSGDTIVTWESLRFQPLFTTMAANIGYFWWSHDIGGHMGGYKDVELTTRWIQFGVFSPIMRLHSGNNVFLSKDPRDFGPEPGAIMTRFLQLRHRLVPYLYSAMWEATEQGTAIVRPMYHDYPRVPRAYHCPDQFLFGPDLLVAPILHRTDPTTHLAKSDAWLPPGEWTDIFTGLTYQGDRVVSFYRPLASIPVLARSGSVITLATDPFEHLDHSPESLTLMLTPPSAEDGHEQSRAILREDDGTADPVISEVEICAKWDDDSVSLTLRPVRGEVTPAVRNLSVSLPGFVGAGTPHTAVDGGIEVALGQFDLSEEVTVTVEGLAHSQDRPLALAYAALDLAEIDYGAKNAALAALREAAESGAGLASAIPGLLALDLPENLAGALIEVATA